MAVTRMGRMLVDGQPESGFEQVVGIAARRVGQVSLACAIDYI
jgi:hypothetical protein